MSPSANIKGLEAEIKQLRRMLRDKEDYLRRLKANLDKPSHRLTNEEIARYSRQIILPNFGVSAQVKIKNASILIVGAGGLGCPAALYLAGAGVGRLGIVDYDQVEVNNLHRQLLHPELAQGEAKVFSAQHSLRALNSNVQVVPFQVQLTSENALEIIRDFDIVLDATDNVATRYLLNDACVMLGKPLVSGSALQYEGQLTVYNCAGGPCYRCIFPKPPPPEAVTNCGDGGVLGAVPGVVGTLQAMEALKIILDVSDVLAGRLLMYDGLQATFRSIKLRNRKPDCAICSEKPSITALIDYEQFCGMKATDKDSHLSLLAPDERISVEDYQKMRENGEKHVLVDVRSTNEFEICRLDNAVNIPIQEIMDERREKELKEKFEGQNTPVIVVCRRGNDSQLAVKRLQKLLSNNLKDITGGLHAWTDKVDPEFPKY